jgi:ABC-type glycerol-3-phosphate transport system substrate-binding protein
MKLLEFCAGFDKEFNYNEATYESETSRIQSGKQLLQITVETDFEAFQMYEAMFGGKIAYKGFPCENRKGNVAYIDSGLAMTTACKDKEGAWSFIRTLLTEQYQTGGDLWIFPTNQAAFDKKLAKAMEKETSIDENGNEVEVSKGDGAGTISTSICMLSQKNRRRGLNP